MASKVFLDANIILDYILRRPDYELAKNIITLAVKGRIQAFITPSIVQICGHWITKAYGHAKAKELLLSLLADITCIDTEHEQVITALYSSMKDVEDAIQYHTALHHQLDFFISRDKDLHKYSTSILPVYTPEEFLKEIE